MAIKNGKFMKGLKSWTTPAWSERKIGKILGKTLLRAGKFVVRRPLQFTALAYLLRKKKGPRWGAGALAGRKLMSKGKWLF